MKENTIIEKSCFTPCGQDDNCRYNCPDNSGLNWSDWEVEFMNLHECHNCNYSK